MGLKAETSFVAVFSAMLAMYSFFQMVCRHLDRSLTESAQVEGTARFSSEAWKGCDTQGGTVPCINLFKLKPNSDVFLVRAARVLSDLLSLDRRPLFLAHLCAIPD